MSKKIKRFLSVCFAVCLISQTLFVTGAFASTNAKKPNRISGANRYKTAVAVSQKGWTASNYAVLARGDDYADALCAGPLAEKFGAPILLTEPNKLNADALAELKRLKVKNVIIVGGTGAIGSSVEDAVKAADIPNVERVYGLDRYETSVKIAEKLGDVSQIAVATGLDFPDALSISAIAAKSEMPILLTGKTNLPESVKQYLSGKQISKSYIVGGTGIINDSVKENLPNAVRLGGKDRFETNALVMEEFASQLDFNTIYVAIGEGPNGNEFADALSGAVLAAKTSSPVVLVGKSLPKVTADFLKTNISIVSKAIALGGEAVVPSPILDSIASLVSQIKVSENYNKAGTYGPDEGTQTISGNVIISARDVVLQNTIIEGDLLLAESIGDGNVTLKNVTVKGTTKVRGGGPNSVVMYDFNGQTVIVDVPEGNSVRLVAQGSTSIESVEMDSDGKLEESELTGGGFTNVVIPASATVTLAGNFDTINVEAAGASVNIASGSINTLNVAESAGQANINLSTGTSVTTLTVSAPVDITGTGAIATANINSNDVTIAQTPATTNFGDNVDSAEVGGAIINGTPQAPPAGGGGGGSSTIAVTAISVSPSTLTLTVGATRMITATVEPDNATNKKINWTTSDEKIATVDVNGKVTAIAVGIATITATSAADSSKKASCEVTVEATKVNTITLEPKTGTAKATQGASLAESAVTLSSNYDATGLKTFISLKKDNEAVNFDTVFDEFKLTTKVGDAAADGPYDMVGNYASFQYGPENGYAVTAGVDQVTTTTGKVKADAPVGTYTITTEVKGGDAVLASAAYTIEVVAPAWNASVVLNNEITATGEGTKLTAALDITEDTTIQFASLSTNPFNLPVPENLKIPFKLTSTNGVDLDAYYRATKAGADWSTGWAEYLISTLPGSGYQTAMFYIKFDGTNYMIIDGTKDSINSPDALKGMFIPADFPAGKYELAIPGIPITVEFTITNSNGWVPPILPVVPEEANFVAVNSFDIYADEVYAGYELKDKAGQQIALVTSNIESVTGKNPDGTTSTLTVGDSDPLLWFNVENAEGKYVFTVVTKGEGAKTYEATLTWTAPKTATWVATGGEGDHEGVTYVEYKLMDGEEPISLKKDEVKLIASKDTGGKWVVLDPNTDATLWFNKAHATGNYEFLVVTKDGAMYKAALDWTKPADPTVENVKTFDDLKTAIGNSEVKTINIMDDIAVTEKLNILSEKNINGNNHTLTANSPEGWDSFYVLQFYRTTGTVKDIKITGADAAIYVNGSKVEVSGTIDVSGNQFGGIEVSKGKDVTEEPQLTITDGTNLVNSNEANEIPTIWEDEIGTIDAAERVVGYGEMKVGYNQKTEDDIQRFYYLNEELSAPNPVAPDFAVYSEEATTKYEGLEVVVGTPETPNTTDSKVTVYFKGNLAPSILSEKAVPMDGSGNKIIDETQPAYYTDFVDVLVPVPYGATQMSYGDYFYNPQSPKYDLWSDYAPLTEDGKSLVMETQFYTGNADKTGWVGCGDTDRDGDKKLDNYASYNVSFFDADGELISKWTIKFDYAELTFLEEE